MTTNDIDMSKVNMEWRVVCAYFGDDGHQLHRWTKTSERAARQTVTDANHSAEMQPDGFYNQVCTPYRPQFRPLMDWTDTDG